LSQNIEKIQNTLVITPHINLDWDTFVPWAKQLLNSEQINGVKTIDSGADRHLIGFTFRQQSFSLNYEHYSDSIWFEPREAAATPYIDELLWLLLPTSTPLNIKKEPE
jgi:hypothetical protein